MIVISKNFRLKLEEIIKDPLPTNAYNDTEKNVLKLIHQWYNGPNEFDHTTSGSTGAPKKIKISKEKITISAQATMSFIDPEYAFTTSLLCLNPLHIGGAMVVYRAILFDHDLTIIEPESSPIDEVGETCFDLASMVPLQFKNLRRDQIDQFKVILVGGAPMSEVIEGMNATVYETFGMTETVSHIALRSFDKDYFETVGDNEIACSSNGTLRVRGAITHHQWLETNDIVNVISNTSFKWIGRNDFVINTGGIKVNPEKIESILSEQITEEFIIGSIPDSKLGNKVVLISNGPYTEIDFSQLGKYEKPKLCFFNKEIFKTKSGKVDRLKTQSQVESND